MLQVLWKILDKFVDNLEVAVIREFT